MGIIVSLAVSVAAGCCAVEGATAVNKATTISAGKNSLRARLGCIILTPDFASLRYLEILELIKNGFRAKTQRTAKTQRSLLRGEVNPSTLDRLASAVALFALDSSQEASLLPPLRVRAADHDP